MTLKVSIVMPVFNGGDYFELALQSALAQTYDNIEIIIVNDGSRDEGATDALAQRYALRYPSKIRYFFQENTGVAGALNKAIAEMTGDVFCWLSHDDVYVPEKTAVQVDFWKKLNQPDAMLISDYTHIDSEGEKIADVRFDKEQFRRSLKIPLYRGAVNGCTVFIPVHLLRAESGPFDINYRFTQDFQLWRRLVRVSGFYHVPRILVHYRIHPGQDSQRTDIIEENEKLWRAMVDETTEIERVEMYGSSWIFYEETRKILGFTRFPEINQHLEARRDRCIKDTLVSVVLSFSNEIDLVRRALASIVMQTHRNLEIILVNDNSSKNIDDLLAYIASDERIRLVNTDNRGSGAARNRSLHFARGEYIAFLDANAAFLPNKVEVQMNRMMKEGAVFSHTSYLVVDEHGGDCGIVESGLTTGRVYPEIISHCPIATPTVMMSRMLLLRGFRFSDFLQGEDVIGWIDLCADGAVLGISEALTVVRRRSHTSEAESRKAIEGIANVLRHIESNPAHSGNLAQITRLREILCQLRLQASDATRRAQAIDHRAVAPNILKNVVRQLMNYFIGDKIRNSNRNFLKRLWPKNRSFRSDV